MTSTRPTGTVTFLFTDIEGSTRLAQQFPAAWPGAKTRHHAILQNAIEAHGGYIFQVIGDAFCAAFATAPAALAAALSAQRELQSTFSNQEPIVPQQTGSTMIRVRMGLHTGTAAARATGDYEGYLTLVRVQRIMSAAYGGQVLVSQSTAELVGDALPDGAGLRDLGLHRLKDLGLPEHLHQLVASDLPANFAPLKSAEHPGNLPTQLTSFVGREAEIAEVRRLLISTRLLSLTGSGGVGKTRLALQVASEELAAFADGVWFVELAPLADPALIPATIASAVGAREEPNRPMLATLGDHFRAKAALVVLDNCEHLIAGAAQVCDTLLRAAPHVKIIATSREALGIAGEHAYRVPSLGVPADTMPLDALAHVASVQLFNERARAAKGDFALTGANAPAVAQLCRRLDGIPLAIELASARVKALSPEQIAARLDDRFRLLTGGSRTALPRQQTLRAAVDWSYSLLSELERMLLRRLSVFAGGWTLEAAEEVCADVGQDGILSNDILALLIHLVDKSLVVLDEQATELRYRMLETIRQYARDKLLDAGDSEAVRNRHLEFFHKLAEVAEPKLRSSGQFMWWKRLEAEHDNLRIAIEWSQQGGDPIAGAMTAAALWWFGFVTESNSEALTRLKTMLSRKELQVRSRTRATLLYAEGFTYHWASNSIAYARPLLEEAYSIANEIGDRWTVSMSLDDLSQLAFERREYETARQLAEQGLVLSREIGDNWCIAYSLLTLGDATWGRGDFKQAQHLYQESIALLRVVQDKSLLAYPLRRVGYLALIQGDFDQATALNTESLNLNLSQNERRGICHNLAALAAIATAQGQVARAAHMFGATESLLETIGVRLAVADQIEYDRYVMILRGQLGEQAFSVLWADGRALTLEQAVALALGEVDG